jgi:hypothetical protein
VQQAECFADRVRKDAGDVPDAQVRRAFLLALGRGPNDAEQDSATILVRQHGLNALCRALFNANEFVYLD